MSSRQERNEYNWCKLCNSKHFQNDFNKWTSGNDKIDKFIQDAQLNANRSSYQTKKMSSRREICPECNQEHNEYNWCKLCNSKHFQNDFNKWTSGNDKIDKFIQDAQLNANRSSYVIEWIPYDMFFRT
ncbi:hypothetical protein Glove_40g85 [Diversispora epigaea]|uniref:Uncharacterized protein n=1 Tax=Diversispora epigaea TaxID=1348612 RepID=A0A397JIU6_9GLOM|nr:hypothetical protein Glove_40g85 [Diversispora epigaea]